MTKSEIRIGAALLAAIILSLALAQGGMGQHQHGTGPGAGAPMQHQRGAMMGATATDELSFLQQMIAHHQEAIETAEALLEVTERPELRELLEDVVRDQRAEIETMRAYLARAYPDAPQDVEVEPMMRRLEGASVAEQEQAWLEDMVMHHMMAVHDARALLAQGWSTDPEIEALARSIVENQVDEIMRMRGWLAEWFGVQPSGVPAMPGMGMGNMGEMPGMGGMRHGGMPDMGQDTMPPHGMQHMMPGMPGMPGMHGMHGTHGMHGMHGMMPRMGHGQGPMGAPHTGISAETARAIARAYLTGRGEGELVDTPPRLVYEVTLQIDGAEQRLLIDAETGEVLEP
jgi:uncharacterized protein (DUF305 family)